MYFVPRSGVSALLLAVLLAVPASAQVGGTQYDTVTLDFAGTPHGELDGRSSPTGSTAVANPFLDRELEVTFTHTASGVSYIVPGFFDGDGDGGAAGDVFRVRFTPDRVGAWTYDATLKGGTNVAIGETPGTNLTAGDFTNGVAAQGTLDVAPAPADAAGFHGKGRLLYDADGDDLSKHYLRFQNGDYFIKGGADSPENLLGYKGFDNTQTKGNTGGSLGVLHEFQAHAGDFNGDGPTWDTPDFDFGAPDGNDAANLIGAVNYLSSKNVNSIYFLPMNIGGDAKDTHPFANVSTPGQLNGNASNDNLHYDISKLAQWEQFFSHAQDKGLMLHFVLNEAETPNKRELDDATLGPERKLFYREMIARFGHHNALQWNVSEEYDLNLDLGADRVNEFADFIKSLDPYGNSVTVHNAGDPRNRWSDFIGDDSFDLTSLQKAGDRDNWSDIVEEFRFRTREAGRSIPIHVDEPESVSRIVLGPNDADRNDAVRRFMTWDIYLSGGSVEWFIHNRDQGLEDFREQFSDVDLDRLWDETYFARKFLEENTPFWEMDSIILTPNTTPTTDDDYVSADTLIRDEDGSYGGAEVFFKDGEVYAIYFPDGSDTGELDLTGHDGLSFLARWYDPVTGLFDDGSDFTLEGGDWIDLDPTPTGGTKDWALLVVVPEPVSLTLFASVGLALTHRRGR
ncbi:MAG: DUF5060 domain-containing protein [Planctomycetota bacterium]